MLLDATQAFDDPQALPSDLEMYSKDIDKYRLTAQKKMLPDLIQTYNEKIHLQQSKHLRTLCEILNDVLSSKSMLRL